MLSINQGRRDDSSKKNNITLVNHDFESAVRSERNPINVDKISEKGKEIY